MELRQLYQARKKKNLWRDKSKLVNNTDTFHISFHMIKTGILLQNM